MSGLLHLVEAATALTHLPVGPAVNPPQTLPSSASTSPVPTSAAAAATAALAQNFKMATASHAISDDDSASSTKVTSLHEKHIQALRAAAADAGLVSCRPPRGQTQPLTTAPATAQVQSTYPQQVTTRLSRSTGDNKEAFPMRLHALLADPTVRDVISWLPHGKSFVVLRPDVFATRVLPRYFAPEGSNSLNAKSAAVVGKDGNLQAKNRSQGVHKYPSFTRKLNRWGFRQISRGPDAGAFCHELFQRDEPGLCRGMVCQKSRKSKKSLSGLSDDLVSVSSASTMGTKSVASREKRPYSSTVTVSTAGATSNKSLPPKKRKSGQHIANGYMMNDIPAMISHRPQKMASSTSSATEYDMSSSDYGSVSSNNAPVKASPKPSAPAASNAPSAEAAARETLARHFHEQHRALALASLMENSRLAMEAAGLKKQALPQPAMTSVVSSTTAIHQAPGFTAAHHFTPPILGAMTTHSNSVFAPTVNLPQQKTSGVHSTAEAAKSALYKAYLQALSRNAAPRP